MIHRVPSRLVTNVPGPAMNLDIIVGENARVAVDSTISILCNYTVRYYLFKVTNAGHN